MSLAQGISSGTVSVYVMGVHLRNVYPVGVPLSRAFLSGVYPIDMHLLGVHLRAFQFFQLGYIPPY